MIAVLRIPGRDAPYLVVLPTAPIPGDVIEVSGVPWRVVDRKFVVDVDTEAEVVLTAEAVDPETECSAVECTLAVRS